MNPILQIQSDFTDKLLSEAWFADIQIRSLRKMIVSSELQASLLFAQARTGRDKIGAGVLVEMPTLSAKGPNLPTPAGLLTCTLLVVEDPLLNHGAKGTTLEAEVIATRVLDTLHPLQIEGVGAFFGDKNAIEPVVGDERFPRQVCYRVTLKTECRRESIARCLLPAISENALTVTLTPLTVGAPIYYTLDESFPGAGNAAALTYSAPFTVASGTVVRWAAYNGLSGSDIGSATIS